MRNAAKAATILSILVIGLTATATAQSERQQVIKIKLVHANGEVNLQNGYVTEAYYDDTRKANIGDYRYRVLDQNGTTKRIGSFSFNQQITVEGQGQVNASGVSTTITIPYDPSYDQGVIYKDGVQKLTFDLPRPTQPDRVYVAMSGRSPVSQTDSAWPYILGIVVLLVALAGIILIRQT